MEFSVIYAHNFHYQVSCEPASINFNSRINKIMYLNIRINLFYAVCSAV